MVENDEDVKTEKSLKFKNKKNLIFIHRIGTAGNVKNLMCVCQTNQGLLKSSALS